MAAATLAIWIVYWLKAAASAFKSVSVSPPARTSRVVRYRRDSGHAARCNALGIGDAFGSIGWR